MNYTSWSFIFIALSCFFFFLYLLFQTRYQIFYGSSDTSSVTLYAFFFLKFILILLGLYSLMYFGLEIGAINIFLLITLSVVNPIAIILSFRYFSVTGCYDYEGNAGLRPIYRRIGHSLSHIILIVIRVILNISMIYEVYKNPLLFSYSEPSFSFTFYPYYFVYCFVVSMFSVELIGNTYENIYSIEFCGDVPTLCLTALKENHSLGISIFCPEYAVKQYFKSK